MEEIQEKDEFLVLETLRMSEILENEFRKDNKFFENLWLWFKTSIRENDKTIKPKKGKKQLASMIIIVYYHVMNYTFDKSKFEEIVAIKESEAKTQYKESVIKMHSLLRENWTKNL